MIFKGKVIHGNKLGRTIGYPTANIEINEILNENKYGIYSCECKIENYKDTNKILYGMASIGICPTIGDINKSLLEVYLFDFNENLYDIELQINLTKKFRNEIKFDNLDELIEQIKIDEIEIYNFIAKKITT